MITRACGNLGTIVVVVVTLFGTACGVVKVVDPDDSVEGLTNLDFEGGVHAGGVPNGWNVAQDLQAGRPQDYQFALDEETVHSGKASLRIRFTAERPTDQGGGAHGGVARCLRNPVLRGRSVTLSGYIKTADAADAGASLWMQAVDGDNTSIAFANMGRRARGTTSWQQHEVSVSLPSGSDVGRLCLGFFHEGRGTVWADDLSVRITDKAPE